MTKQEFMAFSLPYGLKVMLSFENRNYKKCVIYDYSYQLSHDSYKNNKVKEGLCIPILHPLSDLIKEIERKGEKFVPIVRLFEIEFPNHISKKKGYYSSMSDIFCRCSGNWCSVEEEINIKHFEQNKFWKVQKLVEWHFDIAGLIEKREAIDINTLPDFKY